MKIKFFMTGLLGLLTVTAMAQNGELKNAASEYEKYSSLAKGSPQLALPALNNAKTSIDKAAANAKTATLPQTYAVKGAIYAAFAEKDTVIATSMPNFTIAEEALKKAKELDTKGENKKYIDEGYALLANMQIRKGVSDFKAGKFADAYKSFDFYRTVAPPDDTTALLYTGLAAANSKNYPAALENYSKLVTTKYSGSENIYNDMVSIQLENKDTVGALKTVGEALVKYPKNVDLRKREVALNLQSGKQKELIDKMQAAIAADPKNKDLYYYAGLAYSQLAESAGKSTAAQAQKAENFAKAAENYKKAIAIDPNYFDANLNMGYVLLSPAIEMYNGAKKLPANKQKEYDATIAKARAQFNLALPYLKKAAELDPKSYDALNNLWTTYQGLNDTANATKVKAQLDALPKK